jgi:4-hydroxy-4-methyl-2-oxoglutarate aldolase
MLENPPPLTLYRGFRRPDPALVARFRGVQTSHLADAMDGAGVLDHRIKPLDPARAQFSAPALTAQGTAADTLAMLAALHEAAAGDAIVLGCGGFTGAALIGDLAAGMMRNKGVAAFVTDGLARDRAGILDVGMPLFAAGVTANSGACCGPATIGAPVLIGGVRVAPGDIVVGDADGVVVVPLARAEAVLERLARVQAMEAETTARVRAGLTHAAAVEPFLAAARIVTLTAG